MIRGIVSKETKMLNKTISALKTEMEILRQSNIELIKLLTANKCDVNQTCATQQVVNVEDSCKTPTNETFEVNKSVSYAEKLRVNKENLSEENKTKFLSQEKDVKGKTIQEDWNVISKKQRPPKKKNNTVYGNVENTLRDFNIEMLDKDNNQNRLFSLFNFYAVTTTIHDYTRVTVHLDKDNNQNRLFSLFNFYAVTTTIHDYTRVTVHSKR
ncbi:hypothetical protein QE152_g37718 [Popillia japonica]|uniref:Uncharacterized protein n=1 Tax=Popillia japonica TaxID=7064 RepID=A0AAW1I955_POPJA